MKIDRKLTSYVCFLSFLMVFPVFSGHAFAQNEQKDVIKIGAVFSLTGRNTFVGNEMKRAVELAVRDAREKFPGLPDIEVIAGDDKGNAGDAASAVRKLVKEENVKFIVGGSGSNQALGMARICLQEQILCITPSATHSSLAEMGNLIIRFLPSNQAFARFIAETTYRVLKLNTLALIRNSGNSFSMDLSNAFESAYLALGGTVSKEVTYDANTYIGKVVAELAESKVPAIFVPDNTAGSIPILQVWMRLPGEKPIFIGPDSWSVPELWELVRRAGYKAYFASYYDSTSEKWLNFSRRMGGTPETVSGFAGAAYDATMILLTALANVSESTPEAVSAWIRQNTFEGVTGSSVFNGRPTPAHDLYFLEVNATGLTVVHKQRVSD